MRLKREEKNIFWQQKRPCTWSPQPFSFPLLLSPADHTVLSGWSDTQSNEEGERERAKGVTSAGWKNVTASNSWGQESLPQLWEQRDTEWGKKGKRFFFSSSWSKQTQQNPQVHSSCNLILPLVWLCITCSLSLYLIPNARLDRWLLHAMLTSRHGKYLLWLCWPIHPLSTKKVAYFTYKIPRSCSHSHAALGSIVTWYR